MGIEEFHSRGSHPLAKKCTNLFGACCDIPHGPVDETHAGTAQHGAGTAKGCRQRAVANNTHLAQAAVDQFNQPTASVNQ